MKPAKLKITKYTQPTQLVQAT